MRRPYEGQLNRDVQRLEGRIDEISNQLAGISNTAGRAHESAKSAHNRIDEHSNVSTTYRRIEAIKCGNLEKNFLRPYYER